jgi:hypothetical protein
VKPSEKRKQNHKHPAYRTRKELQRRKDENKAGKQGMLLFSISACLPALPVNWRRI